MNRTYPTRPIPAVGGVVIQGERVLLVRRAKPPGPGTWSIPGGALRIGERLEDAVRRELLEETGILVRPWELVEVVERIFRRADRIKYHYVIVDYACTVEGGVLAAGSDAQEARWFGLDELSSLGLQEETLRVIGKAHSLIQARSSLESKGLLEMR